MRSLVASHAATPELLRSALAEVPRHERDAWFDLVLGTEEIPEDGAELPAGCVPYLPCPVDALLRAVEVAKVSERDVFVDVGSGLGRVAVIAHLLTGAAAIGLEIQSHFVRAAREMMERLNVSRLSVIHGDAARLTTHVAIGTVFFLYCPFGGERLERVLDELELIARTRPIRVCAVDLPLPPRPWLELVARPSAELSVYRSTYFEAN